MSPPLSINFFDAMVALPDAYLQMTVPDFEFPAAEFTLPIIPNQAPLPPWAKDLDGSRRVVLVTQGTLSNHNFNQLVVPTLAGTRE